MIIYHHVSIFFVIQFIIVFCQAKIIRKVFDHLRKKGNFLNMRSDYHTFPVQVFVFFPSSNLWSCSARPKLYNRRKILPVPLIPKDWITYDPANCGTMRLTLIQMFFLQVWALVKTLSEGTDDSKMLASGALGRFLPVLSTRFNFLSCSFARLSAYLFIYQNGVCSFPSCEICCKDLQAQRRLLAIASELCQLSQVVPIKGHGWRLELAEEHFEMKLLMQKFPAHVNLFHFPALLLSVFSVFSVSEKCHISAS